MKGLSLLLPGMLLFAALPAAAQIADLTDTWWDPANPGSAVQIVQQGETAFVTVQTFADDGRAVWYVAPAADVYAYGAGALPNFRGTLYRASGVGGAGVLFVDDFEVVPVGELFLSPTSIGSIALQYRIGDRDVTQTIERVTLEVIGGGGNYEGSFRQRLSRAGTLVGTRKYSAELLLYFDGGIATMRVQEPATGPCTYQGPYQQTGRIGRFAGNYQCQDGTRGTFEVSRLQFLESAVAGRLDTVTGDTTGRGRFAAVLQ